jgi:hypothetical protein
VGVRKVGKRDENRIVGVGFPGSPDTEA